MAEDLEYSVSLADHMSGPAQAASKSISELGKSLSETSKHATESHSLFSKMSEGFVKVVEPAEVLKGAFEGVSAGFKSFVSGVKSGEAKEMVAGIAESMAGLAQLLDLVIPGLGQLAAAAIKVGGAFASMTVGLLQSGAELAIEATMAKLSMVSMFAALGGGQEAGEKTEEMLSDLSAQIGITKEALAPFTKSFMAMGIEGTEALKKVTLAAISAQAIMGDPAAAHSFENLTKKIQVASQTGHGLKIPAKGLGSLADMGIRVDEVAKRMNVSSKALADQLKAGTVDAAKFGDALQDALIEKGKGPLDRMGSSMANLKKMFGQSIDDMFEDMGTAIEPFLAQVKDMLGIFSQSTNSGKAMKAGIGGAFTFIFGVATKAILPIKHFFLDLVIVSLKTYILVKKHWLSVQATMMDFGVVVKGVADSFAFFLKAVDFVVALDESLTSMVDKVSGLYDDMSAAGSSFVDGFVNGIKDGIARAGQAASDLGAAAKKGVKDFLGISSPSKEMYQLGGYTSEGFSGGLNAGTPKVAEASKQMGAATVSGATSGLRASDYATKPGTGATGGESGAGTAVNGGIHITIQAPNGVTNAIELTETAVAILFERLALQQGL